jgi:serine/threonine protein kinase
MEPTPEQWSKIKDLFARACNLGPGSRAAFLDRECTDKLVRDEVESLLSAQRSLRELDSETGPYALKPGDFIGRFEILRRVGRGGFGTVFAARDPLYEMRIALKVLHIDDAEAVSRFKREFRSLVDLKHDNLIRLYELFELEDRWFFTMELLTGNNFVDYVRSTIPTVQVSPGQMEVRLRTSLHQLTSGLCALHERGIVHRDLSPQNVWVTEGGRVVVLDFGLMRDREARTSRNSIVAGKPQYMAPEIALGTRLTEAADWYSVGAILYECLTGTVPFSGGLLSLVSRKEKPTPERPCSLNPFAAADLDQLCMELLSNNPENRPDGSDVLQRLLSSGHSSLAVKRPNLEERRPIVGRSSEIKVILESFKYTQTSGPAIVTISGPSGAGKTTLIEAFVRWLLHSYPHALVLSGTCHQSETLRFKALSRCLDTLYRYLSRLSRSDLDTIVPADFHYVARLFPVFEHVVRPGSRGQLTDITDQQELRRRAFLSLLELLSRLSDHTPLVMCIDDLQWGDLDSAAFFTHFFSLPKPPSILMVASYRTEDAENSPFLKVMRPQLQELPKTVKRVTVHVGDLPLPEATELAAYLLQSGGQSMIGQSETIAQECGGNPFLIDQCAQYFIQCSESLRGAKELTNSEEHGFLSLTQIIQTRLATLSPSASRLLETVAVAAHPLPELVAFKVADLRAGDRETLSTLISNRFLKVREGIGARELEPSHDKIREAILTSLSENRKRDFHQRIALIMEEQGGADEALLATHFQLAGDDERARSYAIAAAEKAANSLAFNRAAGLYRFAIGCNTQYELRPSYLFAKLGDVLVSAGRGLEAAEAYLSAAECLSVGGEQIGLRQKAAEQLLRSGHVDRGLTLLKTLAESMNITVAEKSRWTMIMLLVHAIRMRIRGINFRERSADTIPPDVLRKLDIYWSLVVGFSMVDVSRAALIASKHLALALRVGEPYRIGLSLVFDSGLNVFFTQPYRAVVWQKVRELGFRLNSPNMLGCAAMLEGSSAIMDGQWHRAVMLGEQAETIFRDQCTGVAWELTTSRLFLLGGLMWKGEWAQVYVRGQNLLRDAIERGDLYATTQLSLGTGLHACMLAADRPDDAERLLEDALAKWPFDEFDLQHYWACAWFAETALYREDTLIAWDYVSRSWPLMSRLLNLRHSWFIVIPLWLRGRVALAKATDVGDGSSDRQRLVRIAERCATRITRSRAVWGLGLAALLRAGISTIKTDRSTAIQELTVAEAALTSSEMMIQAAISRFRRGQLLGDETGRNLVASAEDMMHRQNVVRPERFANVFAPGIWSWRNH